MRLARQRPHLIRHHGKATPGFPSPGRFDGGVQRQQVGLLGNTVNYRQHHLDLFALLGQALDHLGTGIHLPGQVLDQPGELGRGTAVLVSRLADIHHLL
ncbi:hypothetical protein D3C79_737420 [compost metagenome]